MRPSRRPVALPSLNGNISREGSKSRIERLQRLFTDDVPALIVLGMANIRYLLGNSSIVDSDFGGLMVVCADKVVLFVDSRYYGQAQEARLPCRVELIVDSRWATLGKEIKRIGLKKVGFESTHLTVAQWKGLKAKTPAELSPAAGLVEGLRVIKDETEIDKLAKAAAIADRVFAEIMNFIKPGMAEREIALELDYLMRKAGADGPSFDTIVATGPNSAFPHARAGDRNIVPGDFIKIDFGAVFEGYHSDMTRTVVLTGASDRQKDIYANVLGAQAAVLEGLAPGVTGAHADGVARGHFDSLGMLAHFSHNLGHGVGLEVHEQPTVGRKSAISLEAGMVFTVEPGLYYQGFGGVRIEDMVVMREHGIQILTKSPKELMEI